MIHGTCTRAGRTQGRFGAYISSGGPTSQSTGPGLALLAPASDRGRVGSASCRERTHGERRSLRRWLTESGSGSDHAAARDPSLLARWSFDLLHDVVTQGMRVIDVGCGTGRHLLLLRDRLRFGVGVDYEHSYIAEAARRAGGRRTRTSSPPMRPPFPSWPRLTSRCASPTRGGP